MRYPACPFGPPSSQPEHWRAIGNRPLTCRRARRISGRFARVGVGIPAAHLQAIAAGAPLRSKELTDFNFALIAAETMRRDLRAKLRKRRHRGIQCLIFIGATLAGYVVLACALVAILSLALHASPY